ncbi:MAG: CoA-binding protein [Candidatus Lindowbacteria bacterium]|nr:CoA-binding protein [Candidatus Lindowbacteria bacterium]
MALRAMPGISETLTRLFEPKSIAFIGASRNPTKWGFLVLMNLVLGGYKGSIYPINPKEKEILGLKAYPSISAVPGTTDLAVIVLPAPQVARVIRECKGKTKVALVITAGFGELGPEQKKMEDEVVQAARSSGIRVVGPNCNGVMCSNPASMYALMPSYFPQPNTLSMASQSGNVGGIMLRMSILRNCGFGKYVSTGNEADLHVEDYFEYFMNDPGTDVILSYVEGLRDGKKLMKVARALTPHKPIVMIKGGRTPAGSVAASSHTGSLAGSDSVFSAMCKQSGIILVNDIDELFDVGLALKRQPLPLGNRVAILTTGGGLGVLCSDVCHNIGLDVVTLGDETIKRLDAVLPPWWNRGNPVDLVAGLTRSSVTGCLEALARADEVDCILVLGMGFGSARARLLKDTSLYNDPEIKKMCERSITEDMNSARAIIDCIDKFNKPVLVVSEAATLSKDDRKGSLELLESNGVFPYPSFVRGARVMKCLVERQRFLKDL